MSQPAVTGSDVNLTRQRQDFNVTESQGNRQEGHRSRQSQNQGQGLSPEHVQGRRRPTTGRWWLCHMSLLDVFLCLCIAIVLMAFVLMHPHLKETLRDVVSTASRRTLKIIRRYVKLRPRLKFR